MATQETRSLISEVSICNQALSWVGQDPINSLDEDTRRARWCRDNYPFIRDAVLEEYMWTFATFRSDSTVSDVDSFGSYVHPIPAGTLGTFRVYRDVSNTNPEGWLKSEGWRREGENVVAKDSTVYMWGIRRVTDTAQFTNLFVQALAARMAADMCIFMTENRNLQVDLWALYANKLKAAATRDGQQGSNERLQSKTLVNARYGSGRF
jgi:hypothetical protein